MKKIIPRIIFLTLIFMSPVVSAAQAPANGAAGQALPEVKTYEALRHAISQARAESRARVEKAVEQERVREAWEIGRLIDTHVLQHKERADYGERVLERLSADLGMSHTELKYMLQFARAYPMSRPADPLSWSHYEALLAVNDPGERKTLAERAVKENWSRERLREEVRALKGSGALVPGPLLSQPGKPGTYRVILARTGPYAGELAIDLGFSNYVRLAEVIEDVSPLKEGEIIEFSDEQDEVRSSAESRLFTYRAWVHRVLDGDTIEAVVDLGFGITTTQILRLRGIDAPELVSKEGKEAKEALEKMLKLQDVGGRMADGKTGGPVLIKTVKSDKYDRYLADVFLPGAEGQEVYLNNLLLEKELAVRAQG